ncbi:MAG: endonuclease III [Rhodothermaceae bacterium]
MNKHQVNKVIKATDLLVEKFGIPPRPAEKPDPVEMVIGTILSQNTNDKNSYKAYLQLKEKYKTWDEIAEAERSDIEKEIKTAGLGKQKSGAIKNFLTRLKIEKNIYSLDYLSDLTDLEAIEDLTKYNGVGVKTASCVLLFALDRNVCPVDTHVNRIVNRLGIVKASTPDKTFFLLNENFPADIAHRFHTNLIRLGREVCKPQKPACLSCPLIKVCKYDGKTKQRVVQAKENAFMLLDNIK